MLDSGILTITAGPAFTAKWLAPRLFDFASSHPEIELRFAASLRILDFATDDVDIAIRVTEARKYRDWAPALNKRRFIIFESDILRVCQV